PRARQRELAQPPYDPLDGPRLLLGAGRAQLFDVDEVRQNVVAEDEALYAAGERARVDQLADDRSISEILLEGRLLRDELRDELVEAMRGAGALVALPQRRQDLRQKTRVRVDDLLIQPVRVGLAALRLRDLRADQRASQRARFTVRRVLQVILRAHGIARDPSLLRELAVVVGDPRGLLAGVPLELTIRFDRLLPLPLALIDLDQPLERLLRERLARLQLGEQRLGAIEETRPEIVLGQREQRLMTLRLAETGPCDEVLMHANRAVHLAPTAKQMPEREMCLERFVVDLRHLDEQLERFVRFTVQDEIEAADIVGADPRRRSIVPVAAEPLVRPADAGRQDQEPREKERRFSRHLAPQGCAGCGLPLPPSAAPCEAGGGRPTDAAARTRSTRRRSTSRERRRSRTRRTPARHPGA